MYLSINTVLLIYLLILFYHFISSCLFINSHTTPCLLVWWSSKSDDTCHSNVFQSGCACLLLSRFIRRTLLVQATYGAIVIHYIVFQHSQLTRLPVLPILPGNVVRLCPLLSTATKPQHRMKGWGWGLLLNAVVRVRYHLVVYQQRAFAAQQGYLPYPGW